MGLMNMSSHTKYYTIKEYTDMFKNESRVQDCTIVFMQINNKKYCNDRLEKENVVRNR